MNYEFIGWCQEDNHDKVWGVIILEHTINKYVEDSHHRIVTFWGRRGKKLQTKISTDSQHNINKLIDSKVKKGYTKINIENLHKVYPEFQTDLEQTAFWSAIKA
jgi:predicted DNA-binding WGR domain protein